MMATDLTRMVEDWMEIESLKANPSLYRVLSAMAAEIEKLKGASNGRTNTKQYGQSLRSQR